MSQSAILALADGTVFEGSAVGASGVAVGEVVFNTSMTGYQEILTDPSYAGQLVTLTCPHIGNVGVNPLDQEASRVYAEGLIIRDASRIASSWRATAPAGEFLAHNGVVAIAEIDTRRLTRRLREDGAQNGCIMAGATIDAAQALRVARGHPSLQGMDLAQQVTTAAAYRWNEGGWDAASNTYRAAGANRRWRVVAYDFGVKRNILRMLADRDCEIEVVPAKTTAEHALVHDPDGVFLSNGPGDPEPCDYAITAIGHIVAAGVPTFGICLGHQLLALACGARTVKMKFGHHGANHPVQDLRGGQVLITSQNHSFAVDEDSLPVDLAATHRSLFDGSLQGIAHRRRPAFGFQGHPEASPGPHDMRHLFDEFIECMRRYRA